MEAMKNMIIKNIRNLSLTGLVLLFITACESTEIAVIEEGPEEENHVELTQAQYDQVGIMIGVIEKVMIGSEIKVNGVIDVPPQSNVSITSPYGGFVKYTDMLPGTKVKKGQLLVTIENPDFIEFQQEYLEGLANREFLKAEFERQEELYKENVASGKAFQQAKNQYMVNEIRIKSMEQRLKLIGLDPNTTSKGEIASSVNIYSPITGAVRDVYTNLGKYVGSEDPVMDITNAEDLHVELTVYENDIPKVKAGQRIRFNLTNSSADVREAEVFLVGSGIREDRSMTVHGHLKEHYTDLLPGMYVAAKIEIASNEVWAVPEESVVRFNGQQFIFGYMEAKIETGQQVHEFEMIQVIKGNTEDGFTEIELSDAEKDIKNIKLISKGAYTLLAKAKNGEEGGDHGH